MPSTFLNVCRFTPTTGGTTDWTVNAAVQGYQTPAAAGATNGAVYSYRAESSDLLQWEIGFGTYTSGVLTRTMVFANSSGSTAKINFSAVPQVAVVALAEDLPNISAPQGRLTLITGTPVLSAAQSAKTTMFYTPYVGSAVPIYDGVKFSMRTFSELSVATTDTTKNPAAIGASKVNDWFVWDDAGTLRLSHGPDWTSDTARSAGTAISQANGIWLNNVSITNGPASARGTYVGTTRSNASSQFDWLVGAGASGGSAGFLSVWNTYNRVSISASSIDTGASYTYLSATVRQARASAGNQVSVVYGLAEDATQIVYANRIRLAATGAGISGIGVDATSSFIGQGVLIEGVANTGVGSATSYSATALLGFHVFSANEGSDGTTAHTFNVAGQNAFSVTARM